MFALDIRYPGPVVPPLISLRQISFLIPCVPPPFLISRLIRLSTLMVPFLLITDEEIFNPLVNPPFFRDRNPMSKACILHKFPP